MIFNCLFMFIYCVCIFKFSSSLFERKSYYDIFLFEKRKAFYLFLATLIVLTQFVFNALVLR